MSIKLLCLYLMQNMLHQIKAKQFYTHLDSYQQCRVLQKIVEFKDFSRILSDFPVLFKGDLIFKDFSSKPSKFKYFSSLCEPWTAFAQSDSSTVLCYLKKFKSNIC